MSGSIFGKNFTVTSWGESHGPALGVVIDGCPAGLEISEEYIQQFLDRRKPGQSKYTTPRKESDSVKILSGVFEGKTTGCPISLMVENSDHHSADYSAIKDIYRPGHADYTYSEKYGLRDYRGGGRSSGRETIARVAAGAVASRILSELGIDLCAYTKQINTIECQSFDAEEITNNALYMPDAQAAIKAGEFIDECKSNRDSCGGIVECRVTGAPLGLGEPAFDKLDANLAKALMSIGAVKGVEIGDGFAVATSLGSENNDEFLMDKGQVLKKTNHSGGVLGGISDGSDILVRCAIKPTPSISQSQDTVTIDGEEKQIEIPGRHDPIIVPRAVVVVESMVAITLVDALFDNMSSNMENIKKVYGK